ncbi:hypothetical protein Tco_0537529 [Tanacetum coccineum]
MNVAMIDEVGIVMFGYCTVDGWWDDNGEKGDGSEEGGEGEGAEVEEFGGVLVVEVSSVEMGFSQGELSE